MTASGSVPTVVCARYARALVDLAEQEKGLDHVFSDLMALRAALKAHGDLARMIGTPTVEKSRQLAVMMDIAKLGRFHKLTQNFLGVLVKNRRLNALSGVIDAAETLRAERAGARAVKITTAIELSDTQRSEIAKKMSASLGHDVTLEVTIDPAILGGMIVTVGSRMIDDSVRRKLERLKLSLVQRANNTNQTIKEVV